MSVYKEGYFIIKEIEKNTKRIFPDACDQGMPLKLSTPPHKMLKQLLEWYGVPGTRNVVRYETGVTVSIKVELMDEWAVSDERKTLEQATDVFEITYVSCNIGACKGYDGYVYVTKV